MNFFSSIFSARPPATPRRVLDVETVRTLLKHSLGADITSNYRSIWTKEKMMVTTGEAVEKASKKSFAPWVKHVWECEDQARALIDALQRAAANQGHTAAVGQIHADAPAEVLATDSPRHVYVFAVIGTVVAFYDPTAQRWCDRPRNIYFSLL